MDDYNRTIELVVVSAYIVFMLLIGAAFRKFNSNISDFFRGGNKGAWWLVGTSAFMASISAYTFTGAAGVAYEAGWSIAVIYLGNAFAFLLAFLLFAPWFRQIRAITGPEVIRKRYGVFTQQFYAWFGILVQLLGAGLQLWAMAIFTSAVFSLDISLVIIVAGAIVTLYSTTGGSWAVMATDFVQSLVLVPLTILIGIICLVELGGFSGLSQLIHASGLSGDYRMINSPEDFQGEQFTAFWAVAIFIHVALVSNTMVAGQRYFAVKDGRNARKAALLACVLMVVGCIFWFIPPMAARLLFEAEVAQFGAGLNDPSEASYATVSLLLLPNGMTGLIIVAMFSATMSSLDSGINRNAGILVRDIYPYLTSLFGRKEVDDKGQLRMSRFFSFGLGSLIVSSALYFATLGGRGMFDVMLDLGAMLATPLAVPMVLGLFIRRVPPWAAVVSVVCGLLPALGSELMGWEWNFQVKIMSNLVVGTSAFLATAFFWKSSSPAYRNQVAGFFKTMHTPVDFEKEVGGANDLSQLRIIGKFTITFASFIMLLLFVPNAPVDRLLILAIALPVFGIGIFMTRAGRKT